MMTDFVDEELQIMDEQMEAEEGASMANGIHIEDPIKTLNLEKVITINENSSLRETIALMNTKKIGCVVVVNAEEKVVGIFTERDILRRIAGESLQLDKEELKDYMTKEPELLSEDDPIAFALNRMSDGSYRHIPITHNGSVKYMLSVKDIVDHIAFTYRKNVLNLPPNLKQETSEYGG